MKRYSSETKAAVLAALMEGQSITKVAKEYDIPKGTVSSWKKRNANIATQKKEVGELLVKYLETNLEALQAQAEAFKNTEWLKKQTASDAAVLHGVMTDKAVRLLEALSNAPNNRTTKS